MWHALGQTFLLEKALHFLPGPVPPAPGPACCLDGNVMGTSDGGLLQWGHTAPTHISVFHQPGRVELHSGVKCVCFVFYQHIIQDSVTLFFLILIKYNADR